MKLSTLNSNKYPSSYDQPLSDLTEQPLLKSPEKYSHASQFTKRLSFMTLKGDTLIKIQKWWHAILFPFCQYLSTNKTWLSYKYLRAEHHNIYFFLFPPSTHSKFSTSKENYETLSRALRVYLVKDNTIFSAKAPKWHVKIITYMNNDNRFDLIIAVVFSISPQIGGLGPKAKYLVISFFLNEGETLLKLNRIDLQIRSEIFLLKDETGHINNLTGKYIMTISKLKHIQ